MLFLFEPQDSFYAYMKAKDGVLSSGLPQYFQNNRIKLYYMIFKKLFFVEYHHPHVVTGE
jgi:hypothetical protein